VKRRECCREEEIKFIMEYPGLEDANFEQQITMAIHQWMKQRMCDTVYVGRHFKVTVMRLGTL